MPRMRVRRWKSKLPIEICVLILSILPTHRPLSRLPPVQSTVWFGMSAHAQHRRTDWEIRTWDSLQLSETALAGFDNDERFGQF